MKIKRLGIADARALAAIATLKRGCVHYRPYSEGESPRAVSEEELSNEELAIALLAPGWPYEPVNIRISAQLLSGGCSSIKLVHLARQERSTAILRHIAECGARTEPQNQFWQELLNGLTKSPAPPPGVLPHESRFRSDRGIINPLRGGEARRHWLRPTRAAATGQP
jgi:hypothetical protein